MATSRPSKYQPHRRLKVLRKTIGLTQERLAEAIGISYPYLLAIETGQREMSDAVAEATFVATLIHPEWLQGSKGKDERPLDYNGDTYTAETYQSAVQPLNLVEPIHPRLLDDTSRYMRSIHVVLRAAARKGKYRMVEYFFNKFVKQVRADLGLNDMIQRESEDVCPPALPPPGDQATTDMFNRVLRTLSWRAISDWKCAAAETPEDRKRFRRQLDEAGTVVDLAFDYADGKHAKDKPVVFALGTEPPLPPAPVVPADSSLLHAPPGKSRRPNRKRSI